ncbi:11587_t:CDS:2 [Ambispora gerdemannii]|uniref:11587_t:CDS:1 n=1 Tax=Ambispora gerdemannii TaxID=144530 RepID=A0A9N8WBZ0_9GLOM|nr:11587_t:CDS:2 [Ambispora gerdemannii]
MSSPSLSCSEKDIRVVVGIDVGSTFSGIAFAETATPEKIETNNDWPERKNEPKTNTALQYDEQLNLVKWGFPGLAEKISKKHKLTKPVEMIKFQLVNDSNINDRIATEYKISVSLPPGLDNVRVISDYLRELGKVLKNALSTRWPELNFEEDVLLVMAVPSEYNEELLETMRRCAFEAGLISSITSENLEFIQDSEAAAIACLEMSKQQKLLSAGESFMVVDCGGITTNLCMGTLFTNDKLGETTRTTTEFCGSALIDYEFKKYLGQKIGESALKTLEQKHYPQLQYLIQHFSKEVKHPFDGNKETWQTREIDLEDICPVSIQYIGEYERTELEKFDWLIELDFELVEKFFESAVEKIIRAIQEKLSVFSSTHGQKKISAIFLVGGFAESKHLFMKISKEFKDSVRIISVLSNPITSVMRGAVLSGLKEDTSHTRILKRTYGIEICRDWTPSDPINRKDARSLIDIFSPIVKRGTKVSIDQEFKFIGQPAFSRASRIEIGIFSTESDDAKYCDEPGMQFLGKLEIDLWDVHLGLERDVEILLKFDRLETVVSATSLTTGEIVNTKFKLHV